MVNGSWLLCQICPSSTDEGSDGGWLGLSPHAFLLLSATISRSCRDWHSCYTKKAWTEGTGQDRRDPCLSQFSLCTFVLGP